MGKYRAGFCLIRSFGQKRRCLDALGSPAMTLIGSYCRLHFSQDVAGGGGGDDTRRPGGGGAGEPIMGGAGGSARAFMRACGKSGQRGLGLRAPAEAASRRMVQRSRRPRLVEGGAGSPEGAPAAARHPPRRARRRRGRRGAATRALARRARSIPDPRRQRPGGRAIGQSDSEGFGSG